MEFGCFWINLETGFFADCEVLLGGHLFLPGFDTFGKSSLLPMVRDVSL
jgi:hypothetical protein